MHTPSDSPIRKVLCSIWRQGLPLQHCPLLMTWCRVRELQAVNQRKYILNAIRPSWRATRWVVWLTPGCHIPISKSSVSFENVSDTFTTNRTSFMKMSFFKESVSRQWSYFSVGHVMLPKNQSQCLCVASLKAHSHTHVVPWVGLILA